MAAAAAAPTEETKAVEPEKSEPGANDGAAPVNDDPLPEACSAGVHELFREYRDPGKFPGPISMLKKLAQLLPNLTPPDYCVLHQLVVHLYDLLVDTSTVKHYMEWAQLLIMARNLALGVHSINNPVVMMIDAKINLMLYQIDDCQLDNVLHRFALAGANNLLIRAHVQLSDMCVMTNLSAPCSKMERRLHSKIKVMLSECWVGHSEFAEEFWDFHVHKEKCGFDYLQSLFGDLDVNPLLVELLDSKAGVGQVTKANFLKVVKCLRCMLDSPSTFNTCMKAPWFASIGHNSAATDAKLQAEFFLSATKADMGVVRPDFKGGKLVLHTIQKADSETGSTISHVAIGYDGEFLTLASHPTIKVRGLSKLYDSVFYPSPPSPPEIVESSSNTAPPPVQ